MVEKILNSILSEIKQSGDTASEVNIANLLHKMDAIENKQESLVERELLEITTQEQQLNNQTLNTYTQCLIWFLIKRKCFGVISEVAQKALKAKSLYHRDFWVSVLEEINNIEPIKQYFLENEHTLDKFFIEKALLILSDSHFDIGSNIVKYLEHESEIVNEAALIYLDEKSLTSYRKELLIFFEKCIDPDLIIEAAQLLLKWSESPEVITKKIEHLKIKNDHYFQETIKELNLL